MSLFVPLYDEGNEREPSPADEAQVGENSPTPSPGMEGGTTGQEGAVWEISFTGGDAERPARSMPKFLRERAERLKQAKKDAAAAKPSTPSSGSTKPKARSTTSSGSKSQTKASPASQNPPRSSSATPTGKGRSVAKSGSTGGLSSDKSNRSLVVEKAGKSPVSRFSLLSRKGSRSQESTKLSESSPRSRGRGKGSGIRPSSAGKKSPSLSQGVAGSSKRPKSSPTSSLCASHSSSPKPAPRQRQPVVSKEERDVASREKRGREQSGTHSQEKDVKPGVATLQEEEVDEQERPVMAESEGDTVDGGLTWEITVSSPGGRKKLSKGAGSLQPRRLMKVNVPVEVYGWEDERMASGVASTAEEMAQRKVLDLKRW